METMLVISIFVIGITIMLLNCWIIRLEKKLDERTILLSDLIIKHNEDIIHHDNLISEAQGKIKKLECDNIKLTAEVVDLSRLDAAYVDYSKLEVKSSLFDKRWRDVGEGTRSKTTNLP